MKKKKKKEDLSKISPIIHAAIKVMRKQFGGTKVKLVSKEMYRLEPTESAPAGRLGVNIEINGITAFLGCESMAEHILEPYGDLIAQEFIMAVLREYNNQINKKE